MPITRDIGRRVELISMDPHGGDISLGLYLGPGAAYRVHTYSGKAGAAERAEFVAEAMAALGGMERVSGGLLRFPCLDGHLAAARRLFLEAAKLPSSETCTARPLFVLDRKSNEEVRVRSLGRGVYEVEPGPRAETAAGGLAKLGQLHADPEAPARVYFPCGRPHDALIGLLLGRALNVRAAAREMELAASRGMLAAPSAQR
jgi:hypothetical protein